jgi:hypothetical protein
MRHLRQRQTFVGIGCLDCLLGGPRNSRSLAAGAHSVFIAISHNRDVAGANYDAGHPERSSLDQRGQQRMFAVRHLSIRALAKTTP